MHNEHFNKYYKNCKKDICILCENEHKSHDFKNILLDKDLILKKF